MSDSWTAPETWKLRFNAEELNARSEKNQSFIVPPCGFHFIDDHFGLRPACLHTLMGSTGRGKSTLTQSLILQWAKKTRTLLYLSEENIDRVEAKFFEKNRHAEYLTTNLHIVHEESVLKSVDPRDSRSFIETLRQKLEVSNAEILVIDNITTSLFYDGHLNGSLHVLQGLRSLSVEYNIPIFLICHSKKGVSEQRGIIQQDDVRGSAILPMTSDYFYIFYRIRKTLELGKVVDGSFVYVSKSRDHNNQDFFYRLDYDPETKSYITDKPVSFNVFKSIMKERDKL